MFTNRTFQWLIISMNAAIVGYAIFLEHYDNLLPCPLCVFQRFAYGFIALGSAIALIGYRHFYTRMAGWMISFLFALAGLGLALRQLWLIHLGPSLATICVPGLNYLYTHFKWFSATMMVLQGTSDCATATWHAFGLSMPAYSAIFFACFGFIFLFSLLNSKQQT
jgi:disulfide bond formation protein DsbB